MVSDTTKTIIERAKLIYLGHRDNWNADHLDEFVAIEPESGHYFFGDSFDAAVRAARSKYPTQLSHVFRIGHDAAFHIGLMET